MHQIPNYLSVELECVVFEKSAIAIKSLSINLIVRANAKGDFTLIIGRTCFYYKKP